MAEVITNISSRISLRSRGANPTGLPRLCAGWLHASPASPPLQFPYERSRFALPSWQASAAGRLHPQAPCSSGGGKLNIHAGWENPAVFGRVLIQEREIVKSQEMLTWKSPWHSRLACPLPCCSQSETACCIRTKRTLHCFLWVWKT